MATITVGDIKTRARQKADMVGSNFVSETELLNYVNESYSDYYDMIVSRFQDYYVADPTTFTIASGASTKTIDTDFYKIVGVDKTFGSDRWHALELTPWRGRNRTYANRYTQGLYNRLVTYRLIGNKIYFTPTKDAPGDYRYWYVPLAATLTQDADTIAGYNGYESYIAVDCAIKMLVKEETDPSLLLMEREKIEKKILEAAQQRDINNAGRIEEIEEAYYEDEFY